MDIPTNLADELKHYLQQQANKGDLEARALLTQVEQVAPSQSLVAPQPLDVPVSDGIELGC